MGKIWLKQAGQAAAYLTAAARAREKDDAVGDLAKDAGLDAARLKQWIKALRDESLSSLDHPLHAFARRLKENAKGEAAEGGAESRAEASAPIPTSTTFYDSRRDALRDWFVTGHAIGQQTAEPGEIVIGEGPARPIARLSPGGIDSGLLSLPCKARLVPPRSRSTKSSCISAWRVAMPASI